MSISIEFCETRAEQAGDEARSASLENVRERALRSQAAWRAMADRAIGIAKAKAHKILETEQAQEREEAANAQRETSYGSQ
ncbi:MAG: hypothetical protein EOP21_06125 [Hyphomicrobiales bacterium]|nr:MAG: hypothetical protein EOP21_06125 [Hyphomicrobiales bacterium]